MNSKPLVSVIIPTYNARSYILEAVDSALAQDYENIEVIVINDGSTDDTEEILRPYVESNQIKYFVQENKGLAATRNRGVSLSSGEFIAFLDADDLFLKEKIGEQVEVFLKNKEVGICYSGLIHFTDEESRKFFIHRYNDHRPRDIFLDLLSKQFINPSTVMIRKAVFREHGFFDESLRFSEDWDLWLRLAYDGIGFFYLDKLLTYYRIRNLNNLSSI